MSLWPTIDDDDFFSSCLCSDYAESLQLLHFVVILCRVINNGKPALSGEINNIGLGAVIHYFCLKGLSHKEIHEDTVETLRVCAP